MKKNIIFGLVILLAILAVSSCSIFGVGITMTDRVGLFVADLNGSRTNIIDNIHPDSPGYNKANNLNGYWNVGGNVWDPSDKIFSITNISEGSSSISASFSSVSIIGGTISFTMKDDGDFFSGEDWKIWSCSVNGASQF